MKTLNVGVLMEQGSDFNLVIGIKGTSGPLDLTGCTFLGEMKLNTDTKTPVAGGVKASGSIKFTANPINGDTLTIGGTVITFVTANPVGNQVLLGGSATDTFVALFQFLKYSTDANIKKATYEWTPNMLTNVFYGVAGVVGNAFTLMTTSAGITLSGATLTGGIDPAEFIFTVLNQVTNKGQVRWFLPQAIVDTLVTSLSNDLQPIRLKTPYVFDVKMKDTTGGVTRIMQGIVYVSPQATQEVFP